MKAKLIVEGKEFDIDILDPELEKLLQPKKKTGYERVDVNCQYFYEHCEGYIGVATEDNNDSDSESYECANYYSDRTVAENNARADKLMRQLRRFAVEHRNSSIDWNAENNKYCIRYAHTSNGSLYISNEIYGHNFGMIAFDSEKAARLAIETFHDELIWYFTEYKDSL